MKTSPPICNHSYDYSLIYSWTMWWMIRFWWKPENRDPDFKVVKLISARYILRPKCDCSSWGIWCDEMVISTISIYKKTSTDLVNLFTLHIFVEDHLLWSLRLNNWLSKRGILQNIKASNFVRSINCSICFYASRICTLRSLIPVAIKFLPSWYQIGLFIISQF